MKKKSSFPSLLLKYFELNFPSLVTANIAFGNFQTFSALNSFYEARFAKNKSKQIKELKNFLNNWESDSNLIIVTHFVVISELLNKGTSSGEMILTDKKLTILGNLEIN